MQKGVKKGQNVMFQDVRANQIPLVDNPFSTYEYKYRMTETQPRNAKDEAIWGLVQMGLSSEAAKMYYNIVVPKTTRYCRKSEGGFKDTNTQLWGTSPYLGLGDGIMFNVKENNDLVRGFDSSLRGTKSRYLIDDKSFIPLTWSMVDVPLAASTNKFLGGSDTRQQRAYQNPVA